MKKWNRLDYATLDFTRAARDMVDSVGGGCPREVNLRRAVSTPTTPYSTAWRPVARICWQAAFRLTAVTRRGVKPTALCSTQPRVTDVAEILSTVFLPIYGISPNYSFLCRLSGTERNTTGASYSANSMLSRTSTKRKMRSSDSTKPTAPTDDLSLSMCYLM